MCRQPSMSSPPIPYQKLLSMAQKYCAYQERCTAQLVLWCRQKKVKDEDAKRLLMELQKDDFLNDNRFAGAYARGKFRNNKWGRIKIMAGLRALGFQDEMIDHALAEIDHEDYLYQLRELLLKKAGASINEMTYPEQMRLSSWAVAKGYERSTITEVLRNLIKH